MKIVTVSPWLYSIYHGYLELSQINCLPMLFQWGTMAAMQKINITCESSTSMVGNSGLCFHQHLWKREQETLLNYNVLLKSYALKNDTMEFDLMIRWWTLALNNFGRMIPVVGLFNAAHFIMHGRFILVIHFHNLCGLIANNFWLLIYVR